MASPTTSTPASPSGFYTKERNIEVLKEYREETDIFDRADAMQKLVDEGKTQDEIAEIFPFCQGTVAQTLKAGKLPKKYKEAVRNGDLERDAAILLADLPTTDSQRREIFEGCIRHRQRFVDIMAKRRFRKLKEKVSADFEAAKAKAAAAVGKDWTKAQRELALARKGKENLLAQAPPASKKAKATPEDVREVAIGMGVEDVEPSPRKVDQLLVLFEVMGENETNSLPKSKSVGFLIGKIEAYLDGDVSERQLESAFLKYCVPDSK
jgi:hypothetical protein